MRKLSILVGAVALAPAAALAQSSQIPPAAQITAYGTSINFFRNVADKWQCIYDSSTFTSQGVLSPINITQVSFQFGAPSTQPTSAAVTYPQIDVYLQPAAVDWAAMSPTYASNRTVAFPTTPNFSGPVTTTVTSTQGGIFITIPLTTPFAYDPGTGVDLLFEIEIPQIPAPATANNLWTTYNGAATPTIPANFCNCYRSTTSATATSGSFTGFVPIMQFDYGPVPGAATIQSLGKGCVAHYSSMYELFAAPANFDLNSSALTFFPLSGGYVAVRTGSFLPVGSVQSPATALVLADDGEVTQTFTVGSFLGPNGPWPAITIVSNGVISELPAHPASAAGGGAPTNGTFLDALPTAFYNLADWDPSAATGGGNVWYEESAAVTTITWENVPNWVATPPAPGVNTFQFQLYPSGNVTIAWTSITSFGNNGGTLVGYSPGGTNLDPGSMDISGIGAGSFLIEPADIAPPTLTASNRPVFGGPWNLTVSNIEPSSLIGLEIFGVSDPGVDDLFFIGMPGCGLRSTIDVTNAFLVTGPTHSYSFPVPSGQPSLTGFNLYTTTATLQAVPQNPFGWMTSNGMRGTLGPI